MPVLLPETARVPAVARAEPDAVDDRAAGRALTDAPVLPDEAAAFTTGFEAPFATGLAFAALDTTEDEDLAVDLVAARGAAFTDARAPPADLTAPGLEAALPAATFEAEPFAATRFAPVLLIDPTFRPTLDTSCRSPQPERCGSIMPPKIRDCPAFAVCFSALLWRELPRPAGSPFMRALQPRPSSMPFIHTFAPCFPAVLFKPDFQAQKAFTKKLTHIFRRKPIILTRPWSF